MFERTIRLREGNHTTQSWQWLWKLLAMSPFVAVSTLVVEQKPVFADQGGVHYETCRLPEWYDATGEKKGDIDPDSGECVPNGCISSDYTPQKCEGFGPTKDSFEELLVCPAGTLSDGDQCLTITPPDEIIEIDNNFCPEGESLIDGDCIKPGNKLPDTDDEIEIKLCSDGLLLVDGQCVEIIDPPGPEVIIDRVKECPAGFVQVDGRCEENRLIPPVVPDLSLEDVSEGTCYWENQGSMGIKPGGECRWPGRDGDASVANLRETLMVPDGATLFLEKGDLSFGRVTYLTIKNGLIKSFDSEDRYDTYGIDVSDRAFGLTIELNDKSVIDVNHIRLSGFTDVLNISASSWVEVSEDISFAGGADALRLRGVARTGSLDLGSGDDYVE